MPNEINVVVKSQDKSNLDKLGADARKAGKEIGAGVERGFKDAEQAGDKAATGIRRSLGKLGDAGKEAGRGLGESITGSLGDIGKAAGIAGAGALLGESLLSGFESMWQQKKVGAIVATSTGQASSAAGRMGSIAGGVFADNFGESIDDVGTALTSVFQNHLIDTSAPEAAIKRVTENVMTVSDAMGAEANEVSRAAHQMLVTGVAGSVDEALDMIHKGTQNGLNVADDFLETITEYSTNFRTLGLDGQDAFGLLGQAAQGGARDTDMAADALKEFSIRVMDGSATTARGFKTIGMDADDMAARFAAGGDTAKQALRDTLNALQLMPPGVERSTAAVDLFGTKAEDLGEALFHMDLDNAASKFGDFEGSVAKTAAAISDATPATEKFSRGWEHAKEQAAEGAVAFVDMGSGIDDTNQKFVELAQAQDAFMKGDTSKLDDLKEKYPELSGVIDEFIDKNHGEAEASKNASEAVQNHVDTLQELISAQQEAAGVVLNEREAMREYRSAVKDATDAVDGHKQVSDDEAETLDNVAKSALDAADSMVKNGRSTDEVNKVVNTARGRFIQLAQKMGYSKSEAINLANSLKLIPRRVDASVVVHTEAARVNLENYRRALNNIPRTITTTTYVRGAAITGSGGKMFLGQQSGGISTAETGGARSSGTLINEAGPEVVQLPNGSKVMTAGATRAMAERGLLAVDGILESAATGGARGRGLPAYRRTGQVGTAGHSKEFIDNLLAQGWRYMDSSKGTLYSPWRQERAGANRVFTTDAGRINIAEGRHSERYIQNLIDQGWRTMDGNMNELVAPWLQRKAGKGRRFSVGDLTGNGQGGGRLESWAEATPLTGRHGTPDVSMHITGDADTAVGAMINRLHRDGHIRFTVRA